MKYAAGNIELATTAMCVWETLNIPDHINGPYGDYLEGALNDQGVSETRERAANLAIEINQLYSRVQEFYDEPFDMDFVPGIIEALFQLFGHFGVASYDRILSEGHLLAAWAFFSSVDVDVEELKAPGTRFSPIRHNQGFSLSVEPADAEAFSIGCFRTMSDTRFALRTFETLVGRRPEAQAA
ncbi:hypothetical protein [Marinobacter sp.]|uniref:hypothetical protein n=1 Tax=Marinobacter sp. TaxID=50741 RepID=UPI00356548A4